MWRFAPSDSPVRTLDRADALKDTRFADSALVTRSPHIRFYAGLPLASPEGSALGTLCAIDRKPRQLSADQKRAMQALAGR